MRKNVVATTLSVLCAAFASGSLAGGTDSPNARFANYLQQQCQAGNFSGQAMIARRDKVIFEYSCEAPGVKPDARRAFRIGSVTKQFTAALILKLQEEGKLNINDPVKKYLPDFPHGELTLVQLLNHTSGLGDYLELADDENKVYSIDDIIGLFKDKPLDFKPGESFQYSNSGYALLTKIIEVVAKMPYPDYLQKTIFTPLGMKDSGYSFPDRPEKDVRDGYMLGDELSSPKLEVQGQEELRVFLSLASGAGAIYSTTTDLLKWDRALFTGKLLNARSLALIQTPSVRAESKLYPFVSSYSQGWMLGQFKNRKVIWHGGTLPGFFTSNAYFPEGDITVVLSSNLFNFNPKVLQVNTTFLEMVSNTVK